VVLDLNTTEYAALVDAFEASPQLCEVAEIGGATCVAVRGLDSRMFNRVLNLSSTEPLEEIAAFYGETPWWVSDSHGVGPELEEQGFVRDYGWMKFSRGVGPRKARSDLDVRLAGPERVGDFAHVVAEGYGLPGWTTPFAANIVGRPGWSCYVAYDGEQPAGAGALFVQDHVGWLGYAATLPRYRGRGAQSGILAARIEGARKQGCSNVVTESAELEEDRPSSSYRNILRAGFRETGVRANYRAP
jgi:GNAT superfamily N-acetyltransferase